MPCSSCTLHHAMHTHIPILYPVASVVAASSGGGGGGAGGLGRSLAFPSVAAAAAATAAAAALAAAAASVAAMSAATAASAADDGAASCGLGRGCGGLGCGLASAAAATAAAATAAAVTAAVAVASAAVVVSELLWLGRPAQDDLRCCACCRAAGRARSGVPGCSAPSCACVCCVLSAVKQELVVLVLEPCCCRELAHTCFCARYGARRNARLGVRHLGTPGQARDGARGVRPGHVGLPGRAQRRERRSSGDGPTCSYRYRW